MTRFHTITALIAVSATLSLATGPGLAENHGSEAEEPEIVVSGGREIPRGYEKVTRRVNIADLDLTTEVGTTEMEKRVGAMVEEICDAIRRRTVREYCYDLAWSDARPQMDRVIARARGS